MQNYLLVIVCFFIFSLVGLFLLCEVLIWREKKKGYGSHHLKSNMDMGLVGPHTANSTGNGVNTAVGYALLPLLHQNKNIEVSNDKSWSSSGNMNGEMDPRCPNVWKKQISGNSYADRKEDPWICKNAAIAAPVPSTKSSNEAKINPEIYISNGASKAVETNAATVGIVASTFDLGSNTEASIQPLSSDNFTSTMYSSPKISTVASVEPNRGDYSSGAFSTTTNQPASSENVTSPAFSFTGLRKPQDAEKNSGNPSRGYLGSGGNENSGGQSGNSG